MDLSPKPAGPGTAQVGLADGVGETPVLSIEDFVLGDRARFDSVEYIAIRMVFLVFVMILAAAVVVEILRLFAHG